MATIYDVASKAGVSIAAVSLVMNNAETHRVGAAKRKLIIAAAASLGYTPNGLAKALSQGATRILGLVVPMRDPIFVNAFIAQVLAGVQSILMERGYHLMIYSHSASNGRITEGELTQSRFVDGVIVLNTRMCSNQDIRHTIEDLKKAEIPFVMTNCYSGDQKINYVGVDDFEVGKQGARFFAQSGHTRIALISGVAKSPMTARLLSGFRSGLSETKRKFDPKLHLYSEYDGDSIHRKIGEWFSNALPPSAIFCADDQMVPDIYKALDRINKRIPKDVAILGRGNLAIAESLTPALTTIEIPAFQMGKMSAELLIDVIKNAPTKSRLINLESRLIKRESA